MGRASGDVPGHLLCVEREVAQDWNAYSFMGCGECFGQGPKKDSILGTKKSGVEACEWHKVKYSVKIFVSNGNAHQKASIVEETLKNQAAERLGQMLVSFCHQPP